MKSLLSTFISLVLFKLPLKKLKALLIYSRLNEQNTQDEQRNVRLARCNQRHLGGFNTTALKHLGDVRTSALEIIYS